jgi:beta-phosphoglucomutase
MIKAVIFDFDGVLVDSVSVHTSALVKVLKPFVNLSEEYFNGFAGRSTFDILNLLKEKYNISIDVRKLKDEKDRIVLQSLDKIKLYKAVGATLEKLKKKGLKMAVATSGETKKTVEILTNNKINRYFSVVVGFEMVKNAKPHPDLFLEAARRLDVKNNESIVIEDAPSGIEAAKKAGMKCIAITNTVAEDKFPQADFVISDIKKVLDII